jgi:para-nitrobenzyl esterase
MKFALATFGTSSVADLRKLSAEDLLKGVVAKTSEQHIHFRPDVDGWFLPDTVPNIYAAGRQAHIPLLAGWNANEDRAYTRPTAESFRRAAQAEFGPDAEEFLKLYPASTDAEALQSADDLASARFIVFSTWRWLEAQAKTGEAPVYRYRFDLAAPADKFHPAGSGAFHSDDIEYVFGTLDSRQGAEWRPEDRALSDQIGQYWTNFARTGDPNGRALSGNADLPKWPAYNAADGWQVMHLDATSEAKPDTERDRYLFLDKAWGKPSASQAQ